MAFKWRKWNNILHRDIGYLTATLCVIYGISGVAVNHVADWNPSYHTMKESAQIHPLTTTNKDSIIAAVRSDLRIDTEPINYFRPDPETATIFFPKITYTVDLPTGNVLIEGVRPRRVLFEMNQLHLNALKGTWTYIADAFAVALVFLGISGMFVLKGRTGLSGRGKWFVLAGTVIPAAYWAWYLYR